MAQNAELQERYSNLVLQKLRATSLFANLFCRRYEGQPVAGAVKIPVRDTEAVVGDYSIKDGGDLNAPTTSYQTLVIDNDIYVNELIDGYYAEAVPDGLIADRLDSAGYSLGLKVDTVLGDLLDSKGTALSSTAALTKSNIYDTIIDARSTAKKLHLNVSEMWLAVSPETYGLLLKSDQFIRATQVGDDAVVNGVVGKIGGIPVYECDNLSNEKIDFILGNSVYCHFVDEWSVPVALNDLKDGSHIGASAVQGRRVYGCAVSKPSTVLVKKHA